MKRKTAIALNAITCIGASIVILGAWAKLTHQSFGDLFLTIGLFTEAIIFLMYAFLPQQSTATAPQQQKDLSIDEHNRTLDTLAAAAHSLKR